MLNKRKGMGVSTILKLTLGLMVASLFVSAATLGSLGQALDDGFGSILQATDYTVDIDDKGSGTAKETLSQAAKFVYQRASNDGCKSGGAVANAVTNGEDGYPALSDTYIGQNPECVGGSAAVLKSGKAAAGYDTGQDMEGIYSRVAFEVEKKVVLDTNSGNTWLEEHMVAAVQGNMRQRTLEKCDKSAWKAAVLGASSAGTVGALSGNPLFAAGGAVIGGVAGFLGDTVAGQHFVGSGNSYVLFFEPSGFGNRANKWLNKKGAYFENKIYCVGLDDELSNIDFDDPDGESHLSAAFEEYYNGEVKLVLCPGDQGYIQMNKGKPHNAGEAGEKYKGYAFKFPHIVITEASTCGAQIVPGIPDNADPTGNMLQVTLDGNSGYPKLSHFRFYDSSSEIGNWGSDMDIGHKWYPPPADACRVHLEEDDWAVDDYGSIDFDEGTILDKGGNFPDKDSSQVIDYDGFVPGNAATGVTSDIAAEEIYNSLANTGFNGESLGGSYDLLVGSGGNREAFTMHGDILCADNGTDTSYAKWHLCDPALSGKTVTADGITYECDPVTGDWD